MRVVLLNEGTYPVVKGGVSTWCDQLVGGLTQHDFHLITLVGQEQQPVWTLPANVTGMDLVPMWDRPAPLRRFGLRARRRELSHILSSLWRAVLPPPHVGEVTTDGGHADGDASADRHGDAVLPELTAALHDLALWRHGNLLGHLLDNGSARWVLDAWEDHRRIRPDLPSLRLSEAAEISRLTDRVLAVAGTPVPAADLIHVAANGPASLAALGGHWRSGTPLLLTEHGVYLRERYLALGAIGLSFPVRYAVMALIRGICRVTYAESAFISPVSEFNGTWQERLGACPERIVTIHNAVDTLQFTPLEDEPEVPTVSFVGRIDPLKDLETMIRGFALVRDRLPAARLRLFGPVPRGNEAYKASLDEVVAELTLGDAVTFEGPVAGAMPAFEAGQVVALSSVSEGLPFSVMEAMMAGRPTVNTDVGGVAEVVGPDGVAGLVVPPRDPAALAQGLVALLEDAPRRRRMGAAARERALDMFELHLFYRRYGALYDAAAASAHETAVEDDLIVAALAQQAQEPGLVRRALVDGSASEPAAASQPTHPLHPGRLASAITGTATRRDRHAHRGRTRRRSL